MAHVIGLLHVIAGATVILGSCVAAAYGLARLGVINVQGITRDNCERCKGKRGGVRGNENLMPDGTLLCDYCHAEDLWASHPGVYDVIDTAVKKGN